MKRGTARRSAVVGDRRPLERNLARFLLEERGFAVAAEAATSADVARAVAEHRPDVLLVHEDVVAEQGESIVPGVRSSSPKTRVIVLTSDRLAADAAIVASADAVVEEGPGLKELESALSPHTGRSVVARSAAGPIAFAAAAAGPRPALRERGWVERFQGAAAASIIVLAVVLARGVGPPPDAAGSGEARVHLVAAQRAFAALVESLPDASASQVIQLAQTLMKERTAADILGADLTTLDAEILETLGPLLDTLPDPVAQAILSILGDLVTGGSPPPPPSPEPSPSPQPAPEANAEPPPEPAPSEESSPSEEPSPAETESPSPTETETPSPTETESPSPTETETPSPTETETPSPTETETPSPTETETPSPTETETPSPTETETPSPTETETPSPTETETPSPGPQTPSPTETESPIPCPEGGTESDHHCEPSENPCPEGAAPAHHCESSADQLAQEDSHTVAGTIYVVPPGIVLLLATSGLARRRLRRREPPR